MNPEYFDRRDLSDDDFKVSSHHAEDPSAHLEARNRIDTGARAVNRLFWSLWLLLLPLLWRSSDWIGLLIMSQAVLVAAKLIQPAIAKTHSAASPANGVVSMEQGEDCVHG